MTPPSFNSFWEYATQSTATHRYVGCLIALYCIVRSLFVEQSDTSSGYAGGFHVVYTGMYVIIAGSYDIPTTIEITCVQTITLVGFILESLFYWHYIYFLLILCVFVLLEIRTTGTSVLWYLM